MEKHSLLYYLSEIPEFRSKRGFRHELGDVLVILVMAVLSGCRSLKSISRFVQRHKNGLTTVLELKHGVPSYGTLWNVLKYVPFASLNGALFKWVNYHAPIVAAGWLSADGKALRSTVTDAQTSEQNFVYMVSLYAQASGLVYNMVKEEKGKQSEASATRQMLTDLGTNHAIELDTLCLRLDAAHCEKKH